MAYDGFMTRAVTHELQSLEGSRITKIHQPFITDLVITVRAKGKNKQIYLSASPNYSRVHLTNESYSNPKEPPTFCMLLRKHLEGYILSKVEQIGLERMIVFHVQGRNEIGDLQEKKLMVEIMGRHSNIVLVDETSTKIVDSIKHVPPSVNRYRSVLPGQVYVLPPDQHKQNPLCIQPEELLKYVDFNAGKMAQQLVQAFSGMSTQLANEIVYRAGLTNEQMIMQAFRSVISILHDHHYEPCMITTNTKEYFSLFPLESIKGDIKTFSSVSEMLDRFFYKKGERDRIKQQTHDLERFLLNEYQKNEKKLIKLKKTLVDTEKAEQYRHFGELLTTYMHEIKKGQSSICVVDFYDPNGKTIDIPLDVQKTPSQNAQHYFKKYTKAKNAISVVQEQIEKTNEEIAYFDQLLQQLADASVKDAWDIREELIDEGYIKRKTKQKGVKKQTKPELEEYMSSEGITILVGKNNKQNDYLTNKLASKNDTWLHTKNIPGSHVVIRSDHFSETTLKEAATIAAYFSKAKQSTNVPVDYTKIRYVKKPSGAKLGFVTFEKQNTIFVNPDEDIVLQLRKK